MLTYFRATLLLAQSSSQTTNQQRLESYLSASSQLDLDLTGHFESPNHADGYSNSRVSNDHGTNTARDLASRIKILELFTLHVLPRNEEWAYAREFVTMSEILDEDRRETLLHTLQALEDEKSRDAKYDSNEAGPLETELLQQQEREEKPRLDEAEAAEENLSNQQTNSNHRRTYSEKDYGIESPDPTSTPAQPPSAPSRHISKPVHQAPSQKPPRLPARNTSPKKPTSTSIYKRSVATMAALRPLIFSMAQSMSKNPLSILRFVLFVMGIVIALSRRDVKDRIARITGPGWDKVKRTVGMGVKVSYI